MTLRDLSIAFELLAQRSTDLAVLLGALNHDGVMLPGDDMRAAGEALAECDARLTAVSQRIAELGPVEH